MIEDQKTLLLFERNIFCLLYFIIHIKYLILVQLSEIQYPSKLNWFATYQLIK